MNLLFDECSEWLHKANQDLHSAYILLFNDESIPDTACFHCQQAVEKTLKAFLVLQSIRFERVHNLSYLMELCQKQNPLLSEIRINVDELSPFAVEIRYPGDLLEIELKEAKEILQTTEKILGFLVKFFPKDLSSLLTFKNLKSNS